MTEILALVALGVVVLLGAAVGAYLWVRRVTPPTDPEQIHRMALDQAWRDLNMAQSRKSVAEQDIQAARERIARLRGEKP